ncbi:MAG: SGNH/GDSL hydrolase family protein [Victivallales bacterium]|jgi:hypothetical protein|nr:SGNH/GDSL hydrolase family protein [Victivallales bacterium]MBT7301196.1 SGNH/GDSL hydrolase family protein [Victivallales bacterium]
MTQRACLFAAMVGVMTMAADAVGPAKGNQDMMFHGTKVNKVLFLGNSITRHGPSAKIGWLGNWGMAASAKDRDFVHLILQAFAKAAGKQPESIITNISTFERKYETYDLDAGLKKEFAFKADLVIIAIGENVPNPATAEAKAALQTGVDKLFGKLKENGNPIIVVRSSFWANAAKDAILEKACAKVGGIFVDNRALGKDEKNYARSERDFAHKGVAAHPGDQGMKAIADSILKALSK